MTKDGNDSIVRAAKHQGDGKIIGLGEDLIAKEAKYHKSCRREYVRQAEMVNEKETSNRQKHTEAFQMLSTFLEHEVIQRRNPMWASTIFDLYKEEFLGLGGTNEDIDQYSIQSLMTKVKGRFQDIVIDKRSKKSGNIVFHSSMTFAEAISKLNNTNEMVEKVRCAAMVLRTEIFSLPASKCPAPTSVHTLKESSPNIPDLTLLFFRTLIGGLQPNSNSSSATRDALERKVIASASDAVFNCTRGTVQPWKHLTLGLGLGTMTGSKSVLTVLNRLGHCISYNQVKSLETEIAYTCSDSKRETPAGIHLCEGLATGKSITAIPSGPC